MAGEEVEGAEIERRMDAVDECFTPPNSGVQAGPKLTMAPKKRRRNFVKVVRTSEKEVIVGTIEVTDYAKVFVTRMNLCPRFDDECPAEDLKNQSKMMNLHRVKPPRMI